MVVHQAARRARAARSMPRSARSRASTSSRDEEGIAVRVQQALLGGDGKAGAVDVDRAALQDPVGAARRARRCLGEPAADRVVAGQLIFAAPAVEAEASRRAGPLALEQDRPGVAQPDVAERLPRRSSRTAPRPRRRGRGRIGGDEPHLLALARPHGPRRRRRRPRACAPGSDRPPTARHGSESRSTRTACGAHSGGWRGTRWDTHYFPIDITKDNSDEIFGRRKSLCHVISL